MYVRWWMVKGGQGGDAGKAEQYDAVHPVHPIVITETQRYLFHPWDRLELGRGDPLISSEIITEPLSTETVRVCFRKAKRLATEVCKPLGMTPENASHGLRYNRRTESYGVNVKYGRWLYEHSVLLGTPGITVSEGVYQGLVSQELVRAVQVEAPRWEAEAG